MKNNGSKQSRNSSAGKKARSDDMKQSVAQSKSVSTQSTVHGQSAAKEFVSDGTFRADPFGSYTGHSKEEGEKPVQDVDDL